MARRLLTMIAVGTVLALLAPASASACSCVPLSPESVREARGAVIAKLKRVRADEGAFRGVFVYRVRHVLLRGRGLDAGDRLKLVSSTDSAACGLPQEPRRYGLVLDRDHGRWSSSLCSQTTPDGLRALVRGERSRAGYC